MYSDTHFHFHHMVTDRGLDGKEILEKLADRDTFFGLDIGTRCNDLMYRHNLLEESIAKVDSAKQGKVRNLLYYTAGIWPDIDEIHDRTNCTKILQDSIQEFCHKVSPQKLAAIGECGLDHHWNPSGADGRKESDFDKSVYEGERELFEMQIDIASSMNLPLIIHSRDAFDDTMDVLKNMKYHNGVIHCYSYGVEEARQFLDAGWYIAFGGATTYAKKSKMEEMVNLLKFIPDDRILMETDAPYLTPVPFRGQTNTPVLVEYCYNFVAAAREITPSKLSRIVDQNIKTLFKI